MHEVKYGRDGITLWGTRFCDVFYSDVSDLRMYSPPTTVSCKSSCSWNSSSAQAWQGVNYIKGDYYIKGEQGLQF